MSLQACVAESEQLSARNSRCPEMISATPLPYRRCQPYHSSIMGRGSIGEIGERGAEIISPIRDSSGRPRDVAQDKAR
jgi:hypothetical protein